MSSGCLSKMQTTKDSADRARSFACSDRGQDCQEGESGGGDSSAARGSCQGHGLYTHRHSVGDKVTHSHPPTHADWFDCLQVVVYYPAEKLWEERFYHGVVAVLS